jgi:hypothetical protein
MIYQLSATAIRVGAVVDVTLCGYLPDTCHQATVSDVYPGGRRVYIRDPGAAQVFVNVTKTTGGSVCLMRLVPWTANVKVRDTEHANLQIIVNDGEGVEVPIQALTDEYIVIALTGSEGPHLLSCSIVPKNANFLAIYSKVFGPDSFAACLNYIEQNCDSALTDAQREEDLGGNISFKVTRLDPTVNPIQPAMRVVRRPDPVKP